MASELLEKNIKHLTALWRSEPERYFRDYLKVEKLWDGETAMLEAIPICIEEHKDLVVASGHSLGKDFIGGGLVPYFLQVWGPCIVITTAPTDRQVKKIMWGEIHGHYNRAAAKPPGELLTQEIKIAWDWYAIGFTTKDTGNMVGKFHGFHSPRVFVIASEAQAIPDSIYEQIDAILTGEVGMLIKLGNPLRASGNFARSIRNTKDNVVISFSCLDNPNYIERKTVVPGLCSYEWVEKKRTIWGENDPRWYGRVLGKIPRTSIDNVFSQELIDQMKDRQTRYIKRYAGVAIDVAGAGDDDNVVMGGENGMVLQTQRKTNQPPSEQALRAAQMVLDIEGNFIITDCDGLGIKVHEELQLLKAKGKDKGGIPDVELIKFHGCGKTNEGRPDIKPEYANKRAQAAFIAKKRGEDGLASIPGDDIILEEELQEDKYFENKRGLIQLEDKDDIKERLTRSPNDADCWKMLQYAFHTAKPTKKRDAYQDGVSVNEEHYEDSRTESYMTA